jgi:hypothetical protein
MQDGEIELVRVLQKGKVARIRQNQQPGVRDGRRDIFGVRPLDRLVVVAVHHDNRRVDRLELVVSPVRLVRPHLADLIDESVVFLGRRGMLGIFVTGAVDIGGEGEDLADAILVAHRKVEPKDAAVAPADDIGLRNLKDIHQRHNIIGHEVVAVGARIAGAEAMSAAVHQDHGMMRRHSRNLIASIVGTGEAAVKENHRRALPVDRIVDLNAVGFGFAAAVRGDRRRRWRQGFPALGGERRQSGRQRMRRGRTGA